MKRMASKSEKQRLSSILLADALGSVTEACRRCGISRTQFYEYKRRYESNGLEGLKDLPPVHKTHPQTTPGEIVNRILNLSLKYPALGCNRLATLMNLSGSSVSSPTIQKILVSNNLGTRHQRLLLLEVQALTGGIQLTAEQTKAIEHGNPNFRERHFECSCPGELLAQDTVYIGQIEGIGRIYLQAVIDTYSSYAFATLHVGRHPEHAEAVLSNYVMPCFEHWGLVVTSILTSNARHYCGQDQHHFENYLAMNDIEHRNVKSGSQTNGFVERFMLTINDEFLQKTLQDKRNFTIEILQNYLDSWLNHYNEDAQAGYRNMGKSPKEMVINYLDSVPKEGCLFAEEL